MFPSRYFAPRYFPSRYFPRGGFSSGSYTMVGPTSGNKNVESEPFLLVPAQDSDGVIIIPHSSGDGEFFPDFIVLDHDKPEVFTYTPHSIFGSPHRISVTNNGALANPTYIDYFVAINRVFTHEEVLPGGKVRMVRMLNFDSTSGF